MSQRHYKIHFNNAKDDITYMSDFLSEANRSQTTGLTILLAENYLSDFSTFISLITNLNIPISGGVFPEIIYKNQYYSEGMVIIEWFSEIKVKTFTKISDKNSDLYQPETSDEEEVNKDRGCLVFVDHSTNSAEAALDALYYRSENDYQYAGAGAGGLNKKEIPSIICNQGFIKDALQTVRLPMQQKNHACYGWSAISGPHLVTSSQKNQVSALDYKPIREQYPKYIQENVKEDISHLSMQDLVNNYPIGIHHYGEDMIVRDAKEFKNNVLECFGEIPEYSNIYILAAKPEELIEDVKENIIHFETSQRKDDTLSILFSCIGRRIYMDVQSNTELDTMVNGINSKESMIGTSSWGEIASNPAGIVRLHTMSLVISQFYQ